MDYVRRHEHLIVRGTINKPPTSAESIDKWIRELVSDLDMEIAMGPFTWYCKDEHNRGMTQVTVITTSHITVHVWDEVSPALLELDVYSCKSYDPQIVINHIEFFEPENLEYLFVDRTDSIDVKLLERKNNDKRKQENEENGECCST